MINSGFDGSSWDFNTALSKVQVDMYVDALYAPRVEADETDSSQMIITVRMAVFTCLFVCLSVSSDRLVGLMVKASASRAEDPWFESRLRRDLFGVESYQ